mgnify:CR=1 FL=1
MALPDPAVPAPQQPPPVSWHALSPEAAAAQLEVSSATGLSDAQAAERLIAHGPNRLTERPGKPGWRRFAEQLKQPLVLVLIAAGCVTAGLGEWVDASVILGVVLVNAVIGYWQEARAEGALAALARSVAMPVTVRRAGHRCRLAAHELVPGDIVLLAAGDRLPADLRLLHGKELHTDDSPLTGESLPVARHTAELPADTPLAERRVGHHRAARERDAPGGRVDVRVGRLVAIQRHDEVRFAGRHRQVGQVVEDVLQHGGARAGGAHDEDRSGGGQGSGWHAHGDQEWLRRR